MIYGTIVNFTILTREQDLAQTDPQAGLDGVIHMKHETAAKFDRHIVKFVVNDSRFAKPIAVDVFIPKGVMKNQLIETGTYMECTGQFAKLQVAWESVKYSRAYNGAIRIMDMDNTTAQPY